MGGTSVNYERELASAVNDNRTLLLVGRTGNGKSSTGNSILGKKVFRSMSRSASVTKKCELQSTTLEDGQILEIIDTPGLFDISLELEFIAKELWRFISMAGVHAVLLVLSVRTRFSREEAKVVKWLQTMLGSKMSNNMIVVFTGGDDLEDNNETLDDYLGRDCPEPLKKGGF